MSVYISNVYFEHHVAGLGIGESKPRLSWKFSGTAMDWIQDNYEIEIRRRDRDSPFGYQTTHLYRVQSTESSNVPWPAEELASREQATVRVRSSGRGILTPWSSPHIVEAGLLRPEDWRCALIEAPHNIDSTKPHPPMLFRRCFFVKQSVRRARLYITAHGVYEVEMNGVRVPGATLSPGWTDYHHEIQYQTYDVLDLIQHDTDNVLGVHVAEGWYCGRLGFGGGHHNIWGSRLGVIAQLELSCDGGIESVGSDSMWVCDFSPILSASLYDGEIYDMAREKHGWSSKGFDDGGWRQVKVCEHDPRLLRAPDGPPIRETQTLPVTQMMTSPKGKLILDFGQNLVGVVRLKIPRGPPGHQVTLVHTEVLENGECATRPLRTAKATDSLVLPKTWSLDIGGKQEFWQPKFTFHGFRYVEVINWPESLPNAADFSAIVIHTDMIKTGSFECSNSLVNRLHENIIWSMRGNFVGIPTDCPQRDERLGYTGDVQSFAPTACFLYDCYGILKSWLRNLAVEQRAGGNGSPPIFSPKAMPLPNIPIAIWGDATILVPWDLYWASGDVSILSSQFDSMRDWIDRGIPRDAKGLWGESRAQLGDWLDPGAPADRPHHGSTDSQLVANAFLIRVTDVMSQVCRILGHEDMELSYKAQAKSLRNAFSVEYITASGRLVSDSQTAIALAIQFDLFPTSAQREHAAQRLEHLILCRSRFKVATGFAGTPIIGHALSRVGKDQLFYRMLMNTKSPSWLYPVTMGATTIWERWDSMLADGAINPGEMTSFNHYALGSVANWIHRRIGGLEATEPGWKRFRVAPVPGGRLGHVSVTFDSPYGLVRSSWKVQEDLLVLDVQVPPNTVADVLLAPNVCETVGSGAHRFRVGYSEPQRPLLPAPSPFAPEDDAPDSLT